MALLSHLVSLRKQISTMGDLKMRKREDSVNLCLNLAQKEPEKKIRLSLLTVFTNGKSLHLHHFV